MQIYPLKEFWESIIKDLPLRMFYIPDWAYRPGPAVDFRTWPFCDCAPLGSCFEGLYQTPGCTEMEDKLLKLK